MRRGDPTPQPMRDRSDAARTGMESHESLGHVSLAGWSSSAAKVLALPSLYVRYGEPEGVEEGEAAWYAAPRG